MSVSEYCFLAQTVFITALVRVGLWLFPFRKMQNIVNRLAGSFTHTRLVGFRSTTQLARTVTVASQYVPAATCLTQALTMQVLLGRYGYPSTLRIGVARSKDGHFQAHAWVESDGRVVIGGTAEELAQNYAVLPAIDGEL